MSTLFRNTFYTSLAQGCQMVMAVVLFKVASSRLGSAGFGSYSLATTVMFFVLLFDDFGLNTLAVREIARDKKHTPILFNQLWTFKLVLLSLSVLFLSAFMLATAQRYDGPTRMTILIFSVCGVLSSFTQLGYAVFRAHERMEYETIITVVEKTVYTLLGIMVLALGMGLVPFSWTFALASGVSLFLAVRFLKAKFVTWTWLYDFSAFRHLLGAALPFGIALFITSLYGQLDIVMLSVMKDMKAVGLYSVAHKLLNYTSLIPTIFVTAFFPKFSIHVKDKDALSRIFTTGFKYLSMVALPLIPAVIILSPKLVVFFSSPDYLGATGAMAVMSVTSALNFINMFLAGMYGATNHQNRILAIETAGLFLNVAGNIILIPKYSFMGSAYATVATEGLVTAFALSWSLRHIAVMREWGYLLKALLATGAMCALLLFVTRPFHLLINIALGAAVYFAVLFLTRALDLKHIRGLFRELKG